MEQVYLSIGSNIERNKNICSCMKQLQLDYPDIIFSKTYETPAYGFKGRPFYNLVASLSTALKLGQIQHYLKALEATHQRTHNGKKFASRTLDVDILLFGQQILQPEIDIPRKEITQYNFVLFPLQEIAAELIHPELKISIDEIAKHSPLSRTELTPITL